MSLKLAVVQASLAGPKTVVGKSNENVQKILHFTEKAAALGAQVILLPELFENWYFCREEKEEFFATAHPLDLKDVTSHPTIFEFSKLARALKVVIPVSFFEKEGPHYYNSLAMLNEKGELLGVYRKSHIPDGPGYEEKFYFRPGNTGFKVWPTAYGKIGVGICWDQWYPECARAMALQGADLLLYPTAIGSEPQNPSLDTSDPWQRAMIGHSVSNVIPVAASNRIGNEAGQVFYGRSFITNEIGTKTAEAGRLEETILTAEFSFEEIAKTRAAFGFFRDRRPDLYRRLSEDI